jgi:hypothetical protein
MCSLQKKSTMHRNFSVLVAPELRGCNLSSPTRKKRAGEDSKPAPPRLRSYNAPPELKKVRLPQRSWVKISQIRMLSVERLGTKLGRVTPEELDRLVDGLNEIVAS